MSASGTAGLAEFALQSPETILEHVHSALLLVDVQNRFAARKDDEGVFHPLPVIAPIARLLASARALDVPRFFVTVGSNANGPWRGGNDTAPWLRRISDISGAERPEQLHSALGELDHAIVAPLTPEPGEAWLYKQRFSAFYETGLDVALRSGGVEAVVVCGVASYGCIYTTCLDATFRGFFAFVPGEATTGQDPELHQAAMTMIGKKNIVDVALVERSWRARSADLATGRPGTEEVPV